MPERGEPWGGFLRTPQRCSKESEKAQVPRFLSFEKLMRTKQLLYSNSHWSEKNILSTLSWPLQEDIFLVFLSSSLMDDSFLLLCALACNWQIDKQCKARLYMLITSCNGIKHLTSTNQIEKGRKGKKSEGKAKKSRVKLTFGFLLVDCGLKFDFPAAVFGVLYLVWLSFFHTLSREKIWF